MKTFFSSHKAPPNPQHRENVEVAYACEPTANIIALGLGSIKWQKTSPGASSNHAMYYSQKILSTHVLDFLKHFLWA